MIGTAFYAHGIIACMILIVIAAIAFLGAAVAFYRVVAPLLFLLGLAALSWWIGPIETHPLHVGDILELGVPAAVIGGIWWLVIKNEDQKTKDTTRAQQDRWSALDSSWNGEAEYIAAKARSAEEVLEWWQSHAENGNPNAQWRLGWLYERGELVSQDYVQAYKWRELAKRNLSPSSRQYYKTLNEWSVDSKALAAKMTPQQITEAQRLASEWLQHRTGTVERMRA